MTSAQQKVVDGYHERVISLIYKRRRLSRYGGNWLEEEKLNAEILKIEDERRAYERDCQQQRQEKREVQRSLPKAEEGTERTPTEAGIRPGE